MGKMSVRRPDRYSLGSKVSSRLQFPGEASRMVQATTSMNCIREAPSPNLGRATDYPGLGFSWSSSGLPDKLQNIICN
jgi:hypothetical protein